MQYIFSLFFFFFFPLYSLYPNHSYNWCSNASLNVPYPVFSFLFLKPHPTEFFAPLYHLSKIFISSHGKSPEVQEVLHHFKMEKKDF